MKPLLTPLGRMIGLTAIKFAEQNNLLLNAEASPLMYGPAKTGLTPDEARRKYFGAYQLVWLDVR